MEHEYYEEEDSLAYLQWDEQFYDAVDNSIYKAVSEVMTPMEQRLAERIDQACSRLMQPAPAIQTPPLPKPLDQGSTGSSPQLSDTAKLLG